MRLGNICIFNIQSSINGVDIPINSWVLDLEDIEKQSGTLLQKKFKISNNVKSQKNLFCKNDVLYGKLRPYLNKVIIADEDGFCSTEIIPLRFSTFIFNKYAQSLLMSQYFLTFSKNNSHGTKMPRFNLEKGKDFLFPLPPLSEQKRIVAKIEELLPFIEQYAKKEQELTSLHQAFPEQLKKSILQAAIQGKLTEQNPNDEPAVELVKRIQAEKERLILEKKIKKPKQRSEIIVRDNSHYEIVDGVERCIDDEIPFEIPKSWCWVRLGGISETSIGLTYSPSDISNSGTIVLRSGNIKDGILDLSDIVKINISIPKSKLCHKGDLLICARNGSKKLVGKCAIIDRDGYSFGAFMAILRSQFNPYIYYYLSSPLFRNDFDGINTTTINQITQDNLNNRLIPLPPLSEQQRIVSKIEKLFFSLENLTK